MTIDARFVALDSCRGICAVLVVIFHFNSVLPSALADFMFVRNGYLFVDFFFVLSGFVLCHKYRDRISGQNEFWQFVIRRFARVWPVHAVMLIVLFVAILCVNRLPHPPELALTWDENSYSVRALLPSLFLLNAVGLEGSVWNGPAWSIGAEFQVYLVFALMTVFLYRGFVTVCAGLSIVALAFVFWRAPDLMNTTWDYGVVRCMAGFFAGVVAYHSYERLGAIDALRATMLELAAALAVALFVTCAGFGPNAVGVVSLGAPLVFGAAVVIFARERGLFSLALRARPFKALGRYSLSVYLVHQPLLIMFCFAAWSAGYQTKAFAGAAGGSVVRSPDLILVDFILAVVLIAAGTYRFVELPSRQRLYRYADRCIEPGSRARQRNVVARPQGRLAHGLGVADHAFDRR
ncbi:MAG TPA: acyltransferase [Pseudolabrys sp.]|nr:acyltransferase [Pseudolabrys sp.]